MNTTLADSAPDSPRSDAAPAAKRPGEILLTLVRRELWEHRALWLAPLCMAALLALVAAIGRIHIDMDEAPQLTSESQRVALFYEGRPAAELGALGELRTPSIADLFVAKMQGTPS